MSSGLFLRPPTRAAVGGRPLADKERAEIPVLHGKIKAQDEKIAKYEAKKQGQPRESDGKTYEKAQWETTLKMIADLEDRKATTDAIRDRIKDGETIQDMGPLLGILALQFIRNGISTVDQFVDAVHEGLGPVDSNIARRQTLDAISGYRQELT